MTVTSQTCSISKLHNGRTVYLRAKITAALAEHFPLSKDAHHDYRAEFNDKTKELKISIDS